jgi:molybdopterin converting factor small subunit
MRVTVRLFARLRDLAGAGEMVREVPDPATVRTVWQSLTAEVPSLSQYEGHDVGGGERGVRAHGCRGT